MIAVGDPRGVAEATASAHRAGTPPAQPTAAAANDAPAAAPDGVRVPLDDTADAPVDEIAHVAEAVSLRAQAMLLRQQSLQQDLQLRLDRMRADFNAAQEERSEQLREMNALRDMAVEQGKKDDEILKKYIAMI